MKSPGLLSQMLLADLMKFHWYTESRVHSITAVDTVEDNGFLGIRALFSESVSRTHVFGLVPLFPCPRADAIRTKRSSLVVLRSSVSMEDKGKEAQRSRTTEQDVGAVGSSHEHGRPPPLQISLHSNVSHYF